MREFKADLHIHTCLSPCADLSMSPRNIVAEAQRKKIDVLAVCDHNSAENAGALIKAARHVGICIIPGLEVTSAEEVHVLALFGDLGAALSMQEKIYECLPGENNEAVFGQQILVNDEDEILGFSSKLLAGATTLNLEKIVELIHVLQGLAVAAHVDRMAFGIVGHLGILPPNLSLDALEVSPFLSRDRARELFGPKLPVIASSDAHFLPEIGQAETRFLLEEGTFEEIRMALQGLQKREILHG